MDREDMIVSEEVDSNIPNLLSAYKKYERGVKYDTHLNSNKIKDEKPQRKYKRNKKANRKKWITPVRRG